jgi:8-oxo-dGTP pyrophosphatase MutT (NUDIX family)
MQAHKAVPIVLRQRPNTEVLAFEHPLAGLQLVKGSIEQGENAAQAAVRELREEAGIVSTVLVDLGVWQSGHQDQVWSFHLCETADSLPDRWTHHAADDGGHVFHFVWHPIDVAPNVAWHPVFQRALAFVSTTVPNSGGHPQPNGM